MKKIISGLIATITISSLSFGQATLEHTYSSSMQDYAMTNVVAFYANGLNYYTYNRNSQLVQVYNQNHNLTYSFTIPIDTGYYMTEFLYITDTLFNADNQVEFLYKAYKNGGGGRELKIYLCNQSGNLLQSFPNRYYAGLKKTANNDYKLILGNENQNSVTLAYDYDVYSLTGTLSTEQQQIYSKNISFAFPNPANDLINISNKLSNNEISTLEIYNIEGKKILEKKVSNNNEPIKLDISTFSSGIYIYKLNGETNRFIKN
ncbi:Secretion system C-terminal sorting domain [Flavobacteriaceae bacterium]